MEHHSARAVIHESQILLIVRRQGVNAIGEVALLDPILDLFAGPNKGVGSEGTFLSVSSVKFVVAGVTSHQIHVVHGAGPARRVSQGEGDVTSFLHLIAHSFQLVDGGGNFHANFFKDSLVVEDIAAAQTVEGDGQDLAIIGGLSHSSLDKCGMIICIEHLGDIVDKAGLIVLGHGAATPVLIHIGALARAHCHDQLLLVVVVLLVDQLDGDVGIGFLKTRNRTIILALAGLLSRSTPNQNGQGLAGQLRDVLVAGFAGLGLGRGLRLFSNRLLRSGTRRFVSCRGSLARIAGATRKRAGHHRHSQNHG